MAELQVLLDFLEGDESVADEREPHDCSLDADVVESESDGEDESSVQLVGLRDKEITNYQCDEPHQHCHRSDGNQFETELLSKPYYFFLP